MEIFKMKKLKFALEGRQRGKYSLAVCVRVGSVALVFALLGFHCAHVIQPPFSGRRFLNLQQAAALPVRPLLRTWCSHVSACGCW